MNVRKVKITTDAAGAFSVDTKVTGEVVAIGLDIGTLSTPDITITDLLTSKEIFNKAGIAADGAWQTRALAQTTAGVDIAAAAGPPAINDVYVPIVCFGTAHIVVAGGGNTLTGYLYITSRG